MPCKVVGYNSTIFMKKKKDSFLIPIQHYFK
jgi:hypothetical protein